jgi:hypothetical protein
MAEYNHYQSLAFAIALTESIMVFHAHMGRFQASRPAPLTYPVTPPSTPEPWFETQYFDSFVPYDMDYDHKDTHSSYSF